MSAFQEEGDGSLNEVFEQVPLSVFPRPALGKIVTLASDTPILDAVKTLSKHHILSAPVYDVTKSQDDSWSDRFLGIVDMGSICMHMFKELLPEGKQPEDFTKEMEAHEAFKKTTVADAATFAKLGPFVPVDAERGNLLDPMLLCGLHSLRRVPVVTPGKDVINIITQSALVQTLSANLERFKSVGGKTLQELGLAESVEVLSVKETDSLLQAFNIIQDKDVSAVPVVNELGAIVGNISARDVRYIIASNKLWKLLRMNIRSYLDVVTDGRSHSAITCAPATTMEDVIKRLVESRIHRIYVVDKDNKPVRVVSLRDILTKFVKEPKGYFGRYFQ